MNLVSVVKNCGVCCCLRALKYLHRWTIPTLLASCSLCWLQLFLTAGPNKEHHSEVTEELEPARVHHPCGEQFLNFCRRFDNAILNKSILQKKWPKLVPINGLRQAIVQHNDSQRRACLGHLSNPRLLVFTCNNSPNISRNEERCHAMADGFRGVALAFIIAVLEKRSFFMHTVNWLQLENFFTPRMLFQLRDCPALAKPDILRSVAENVVVYNLPEEPASNACRNMKKFGLLGSAKRVLSMHSNQVSECLYTLLKSAGYSLDLTTHESVTRLVLETLFEFPAKILESTLKSFLRTQKVYLDRSVCVHVRSGIRFNHGVDDGCYYKNIDDVWRCARVMEITSAGLTNVEEITWVIIGDNDLHKQIALDYIMNCSDPLFTHRRVKRRIIDTSSFGAIAHSSAGSKLKKKEQFRVFFDLALLSECHYLILTASGYSQLAVILNRDCSERPRMFVNKRNSPTENLSEVCVSLQPRC